MTSQTFVKLAQLAQTLPTDSRKPEDLKAAFSTCGTELMIALDKDRIRFDRIEDQALFMGLLAVTGDYAMDGNLKNAVRQAAIN